MKKFLIILAIFSTLSVNAQTWSIVGNNPLGNDIHGLGLYGSVLAMGGSFNNNPGNKIAWWDDTQFGTFGSGMGLVVRAVREWNGKLIAIGDYWNTGQPCTNCNGVAIWDGVQWSAMGTGFNNDVLAITIWNGDPVVAGDFTLADGKNINRIARWTGTTWDSIGCGFNKDVRALEVYNGELYAGGDFSNACGNGAADRIARWDVPQQEWKKVVDPGGLDSTVRALKVINGELWMGGHFIEVGGNYNCGGIARYDGTNWYALGTGLDSYVRAIEEYNGEVYVGGDFLNAGGTSATRIARWNGTAWNACGSGVSAYIRALQVYNGTLYVGGSFHVAGGITADYIAKWHMNAPIGGTLTNSVNISCFGSCDGSATVAPTGGTSPYTYQWDSGANNQTTAQATNLCAGSYSCTITDSIGSQAIVNVTITQPVNGMTVNAAVSSSYNGSNISCFGSTDGAATASATGGQGGYTYQWDSNAGSQTTATATGLGAGTYYVTVTDQSGCSSTDSVTVTAPASVAASISGSTDVDCFGNSSGTATAAGTGGTGSFSYQWNTTPVQNTATASGLPAGNYCVTVSDQNGCTNTTCVTISQPAVLSSSSSVNSSYNGFDVSCAGASDGSATVSASGGTGSYSYSWGPTAGNQTTATATGLAAGSYTVTITDQSGCTTTETVTLGAPTAVTASSSATQSSCGASDGSITVTPSGGTGTYSYNWDSNAGSQTTATATGLGAGIYYVTITDQNGCTAISSDTVTNPGGPSLNISGVTDVLCFGDCNGSATVNATGNGPFTYTWDSNAGSQTTNTAGNLCSGTYSVSVEDVNGCIEITAATVSSPSVMSATLTSTPASNCNGTATVTPSGGTAPYTYLWDANAGNQTTATASSLCDQQYCVTITDANNCTLDTCLTVLLGIGVNPVATLIEIYPNPASSWFNVNLSNAPMGEVHFHLYNSIGELVREGRLNEGENRFERNVLSSGVYFFRISDEAGLLKEGKILFR